MAASAGQVAGKFKSDRHLAEFNPSQLTSEGFEVGDYADGDSDHESKHESSRSLGGDHIKEETSRGRLRL